MSFFRRERSFWVKIRVLCLSLVLLAGTAKVGHGAWVLGVERREELQQISRGQYSRQVKLLARRGMVMDRHGAELAVEVEVDSVFADPRDVEDPAAAANLLHPLLEIDRETLYRRMASRRHFVWLRRQVSPSISRRVKALGLPGVGTVPESKRFYPGKEMAAQVLGFTGVDGDGLDGIEKLYDTQLMGTIDAVSGLSDGRGRIVFANVGSEGGGVVGNNVVLTIDRNLQFVVEEELDKVARLFQAKSGHITVMDPDTGEVLAMASWPSFNVNDVRTSNLESRRNRVVLDVFEPGSTLKVFTLAAGLNSGVIRVDDTIFCERGRMEFYDVIINDDHRDGWLNMTQCLKRSSNICFAKMAAKIGKRRMYQYLRRFGFGEKTGIDVPYEMRGLFQHHSQWSEFLNATISFGQGIGVTGIQMATALGAIANGGNLMKPRLVKRITNSKGESVWESSPEIRRRVISRRTARLVSDIMTSVTEEGGTGTQAAVEGYVVAGKTGTAQKSIGSKGYTDKHRFVASFFGFLPADDPKLVISAVFDEPLVNYYGSNVAGPPFRRIAHKAMRDMGVSPSFSVTGRKKVETATDNDDISDGPPVSTDAVSEISWSSVPLKEGQVRTPDLLGRSMMSCLKTLNEDGLRPYFVGSGLAVEQIPPPGVPVDEGGYVQVSFSPRYHVKPQQTVPRSALQHVPEGKTDE